MEASPLVIVCAADNDFAMPLAVTFYSALTHLSEEEHVALFAIDAGVDEENKRRVNRVVARQHANATLEWVRPERCLMDGLAGNQHLPESAFFRLFAPHLLPDRFEKAIYLDCDTLVLADLRRLWNLELNGHSHLAVQDLGQPYVSSSPEAVPDYRELGLPADAKYFNSGLMVMNLRRWRAERISERVIDYMRGHDPEDLRFLDQNGLNAVLAGQWGELDPRWNQMHGMYGYASWEESPFSREVYRDVIERPHIIHYTYTWKPWKPGHRHPRQRLYLRYLKASGWFTPGEWCRWKARHAAFTLIKRAVSALRRKARVRTRVRRWYRRLRKQWSAR